MDAVGGFATFVWPPTGIALTALLLFGTKLWPGIWLAAFCVNLQMGASTWVAATIGIGNTLEAVFAVLWLQKYVGFHRTFDRLRDVLGFVSFAAFLSTTVNATIGVTALCIGKTIPWEQYQTTWFAWWLGDIMGDLIVAPMLLLWIAPMKLKQTLWTYTEALSLGICTVFVGLISFGGVGVKVVRPYFLFPPLIWACIRFGQKGSVLTVFLIATLAIWFTAIGQGPFASTQLREGLSYLDMFLVVLSVTGLVLASIVTQWNQTHQKLVLEIEERKRQEARIRESEARFRLMADAAPVMIWISGTDKLYNYFNKTWLAFRGRTFEEELGNGWAQGLHPVDLERCLDTYSRSFDSRKDFKMEYRLKRCDGGFRFLDHGTPRYAPDGTFQGYIGSCIDIDDRKKIEKALNEAIGVRDEFLSVASHELRTPLTAMQFQIEILDRIFHKRAGDLAQTVDRSVIVQGLLQQIRRFSKLINDMFDVSRITAGQFRLDLEDIDFSSIVKEVCDRHKEESRNAGCEIKLEIDENPTGRCDRTRLDQIVTNLLSNALKFGPGQPIEIKVGQNSASISLSVKDHGIGISSEHQKNLFKRFKQFAPKQNYHGLGLGLWIVHKIVKGLGGEIVVESQPGKGSIFKVILPRNPTTIQDNFPRSQFSSDHSTII